VATAIVDSPKNLPSNQPSNNISEQVYKSQFLTNLNANEIFSMHRHDLSDKNDDTNNLFKIYHQNIRGLKGKTDELMLPLLTEAPHLICVTEHHLKNYEIDAMPISKYKLGAKYCRKKFKNGGVCIYIQEALKFSNINLQKHCKEQDFEIAAVQLKLKKKNVIVFLNFLNKLDSVLSSLHNYQTGFIIWGNININYLGTNNKENQLDNLLDT
jgi:exonuclease III